MRHSFELTSSQSQFSDTEILSESSWVCLVIHCGSVHNCMQTQYANRPVLLKPPILVLFLQEKKFQVDFRRGGPGLKAGYLAGVGLLHNVNGARGGTARRGVAKAEAPNPQARGSLGGARGGPGALPAPPVEGARGSQASSFSLSTGRGAERLGLARFSRGRRRWPAWRTRSWC